VGGVSLTGATKAKLGINTIRAAAGINTTKATSGVNVFLPQDLLTAVLPP
jgi:hypothetical protein